MIVRIRIFMVSSIKTVPFRGEWNVLFFYGFWRFLARGILCNYIVQFFDNSFFIVYNSTKNGSRCPKVCMKYYSTISMWFSNIYRTVVNKLVFFTAAMIIMPLTTFFFIQYLSSNNSILSGGLAALVANIVLIGYVVAAYVEEIPSKEQKKEQ